MDPVALVYAAKLCLGMGGEPAGKHWVPPDWAMTRWVELPWTTRFRLWIGPTRLYGDPPG